MPKLEVLILGAALALVAPGGLHGQALAPGERIRARTPGGRIEARVLQLTDTALVLERKLTGDTFSVSYGKLADVRAAWGKRPHPVAGALGGIAGAIGVPVIACQVKMPHCVVGGFFGGLALGVGLARLVKTDRWVSVPVVPAPTPSHDTVRLLAAPSRADTVARQVPPTGALTAPTPTDTAVRPGPGVPATAGEATRALARAGEAAGTYGSAEPTGARIRYHAAAGNSRWRVARVLRMEGDTLVIMRDTAGSRPERVRSGSLVDLEMSRGWQPSTGLGATIGMCVGGVGMGVWGAASARDGDSALAVAFLGGLVGGALGAGLGALIGAADHRERWSPVAAPMAQPRATAGTANLKLRFAIELRR
jgi:hypothetical protein